MKLEARTANPAKPHTREVEAISPSNWFVTHIDKVDSMHILGSKAVDKVPAACLVLLFTVQIAWKWLSTYSQLCIAAHLLNLNKIVFAAVD